MSDRPTQPAGDARRADEPAGPTERPVPERVISGGQTGADQAGLRAAARCGIPTGGWMPAGFATSRGPDPELARRHGLREHAGGYAERTAANVRDADATLRFAASFATPGEKCTIKWVRHYGRPHLDLDVAALPPPEDVAGWVRRHRVRVLNVTGNVEARSPRARAHGIGAVVEAYLVRVFALLGHPERPAVSDTDPAAGSGREPSSG